MQIPTRRTFLCAGGSLLVGAGFAGCIGGDTADSDPARTTTDSSNTAASTTIADPTVTPTRSDKQTTGTDRHSPSGTDREPRSDTDEETRLSTDEQPSTSTTPESPEATSTVSDDSSEWSPTWSMPFDEWPVLGLDAVDDRLFATLSKNNVSAVAAIDPAAQSVLWQTESEGEAVKGSHASYQHIARSQWGVTFDSEAVYAVTSSAGDSSTNAVHAFNRATGKRRWSLRRKRELAVAGVIDDLVVATSLELSEQRTVSHQTSESPLSTIVYGLDAVNGTVHWTHEFVGVQDVAVNSNGVYVAVTDRLVGLGLNGKRRFSYEQGPATRVEAAAGRIFYLTGDYSASTLYGVAPSGSMDWQHDLPVNEFLLVGDRLYVGGKAVAAIEANGTIAWRDNTYGEWLLLDPDRDTLYTRSQKRSDAVTAYSVDGEKRWTFDPLVNDMWPEAATNDALIVSAITGDNGNEPFLTVYAVNSAGKPTASFGKDTVFDATGLNGTAYLADGNSANGKSNLLALDP